MQYRTFIFCSNDGKGIKEALAIGNKKVFFTTQGSIEGLSE